MDHTSYLTREMTSEFINQYLQRSSEIIGDRSPAEKAYDEEIVAGLEKGLQLSEALKAANRKFPSEALQIDKSMLPDIKARYDYLAEHKKILERLGINDSQ